ncbi:NAD(P)H-binding protein [Phenylobacterium sp.]|uniref:NAD(P)H-binding protein n=1 Tax=Phenylobacterium sp. TaxID=1871053 RepID=UPI00273060BA|nr:NAD(P)H-binding protein [Phenylobacterium sp.]MDP1617601.1 NAD(P)H-binding protein [Phenylobacterium sp.]MDP1988311.1 NAD(P)H-binding protein [Phenylobacterium sp.]
MTTRKTVLIVGANGRIGGAVAKALLQRGWQVRGLARDPSAGRQALPGIDWRTGDAMNAEQVSAAADGVSAIVHAVNPAGYLNWETLVLPMIDNTIAAARAAGGARVVLPGTIYNYDVARTPLIGAETPQEPRSRKGVIRVAMEQRLEAAAPEVPSLILRAGDFFGPGARSSWFSQAMVKPDQPVRKIVNVARGPGHSWAYLPDLAETFASLMEAPERLHSFERLQFEGLYDESGTVLADGIRRALGRDIPSGAFPWWMMQALSPFGGFPKEAADIAPYWRWPARFDNRRLVELLGSEPRTPLDQALRASLASLGAT